MLNLKDVLFNFLYKKEGGDSIAGIIGTELRCNTHVLQSLLQSVLQCVLQCVASLISLAPKSDATLLSKECVAVRCRVCCRVCCSVWHRCHWHRSQVPHSCPKSVLQCVAECVAECGIVDIIGTEVRCHTLVKRGLHTFEEPTKRDQFTLGISAIICTIYIYIYIYIYI